MQKEELIKLIQETVPDGEDVTIYAIHDGVVSQFGIEKFPVGVKKYQDGVQYITRNAKSTKYVLGPLHELERSKEYLK